jgi:hypothetical protein
VSGVSVSCSYHTLLSQCSQTEVLTVGFGIMFSDHWRCYAQVVPAFKAVEHVMGATTVETDSIVYSISF